MPRAADSRRLTHVFVRGLRFETELLFVVRGRGTRRPWRPLPAPEAAAGASARVVLMQAHALLTGKAPGPQALARAVRIFRADAAALTPDAFLASVPRFAPELLATWHPGLSGLRSGDLGPRPALAYLATPKGARWALVLGLELEQDMEHEMVCADPRGLLLLDPSLASPWGTGYNARLLLGEQRWLGLDGEVQRVVLQGLIQLRCTGADG